MEALQDQAIQKEIARNHILAVGGLRVIFTAMTSYASIHRRGYPTYLVELGPGGADLIDSELATGLRNGYKFNYSSGRTNRQGHVTGFTLHAVPVSYGKTGWRSFFLDEIDVIHSTTENRRANAKDPPLQ